MLSYSQAEPGRELTQPSPHLLAELCTWAENLCYSLARQENSLGMSLVVQSALFLSESLPSPPSLSPFLSSLWPIFAMHSRCIGGAAIGDLGTQKWHRCRRHRCRWVRGSLAHRSFNDNGESNGETVTGAPSQQPGWGKSKQNKH